MVQTPSMAWLTRSLRAGTILLMIAMPVYLVATFAAGGYNWDLDHEIYFGQRLLAGELIWTREFHDKLPFLQILLAIPAAFEAPVTVWRAMSVGLCLAAAAVIFTLTPRVFDLTPLPRQTRILLLAFAACLYVDLVAMMPSGLSTINPAATSLALLATLMILLSARRITAPWTRRAAILMGGGLIAAAAISIRPYFLAPLALTLLWAGLGPGMSVSPRRPRQVLVFWLGWGVSIGAWGLAFNVLPYFLTGHVDALAAGLRMAGGDLNPTAAAARLLMHLTSGEMLLVGGLVAGLAAALALGYRRGGRTSPALFYCLCAMMILAAYITTKHFWPHYLTFFVGYLCLALVAAGAWLAEGHMRDAARRWFPPLAAAGYLGLAVTVLIGSVPKVSWYVAGPGRVHDRAGDLAALQDYLAETGQTETPFLAPQEMFLHWQLDEPRHGFPHAANTRHIFRGWWSDLDQSAPYAVPRDGAAYCDLLTANGPELVVIRSGQEAEPCLTSGDSGYVLATRLPLAGDAHLAIYRRSPASRNESTSQAMRLPSR